jgi:hypothetical protein
LEVAYEEEFSATGTEQKGVREESIALKAQMEVWNMLRTYRNRSIKLSIALQVDEKSYRTNRNVVSPKTRIDASRGYERA